MRIFKNAWFDKFARRAQITDGMLVDAIKRAELGLIDADLGGGLIKQRLARPGRGKSGGYRTLVLFRSGNRAVFGFAKSDRENISAEEESALKRAAKLVLGLPDDAMRREVQSGRMKEVTSNEQGL
uniref:Type II toxin-antitoxin system RelE/ParE family toxin n=1 Tax=Agrobacterium albertimagni TaxID=147266 RepID=A0A7C1T483_9HYPH